MSDEVPTNLTLMTAKAVIAVILFIITYIVLVIFAAGLTLLFLGLGLFITTSKAAFLTIGIFIALASIGFFIMLFLFKFIGKKHKVDHSHLTQVTEREEPRLFALIRDVVKEVQTDFPKRVYLSSDVNAGVFYDSSFWSMILPIRKNLQIGVGLVNIISEQEFKAILAHEFGHFSQSSMRVGSYVYHVNQVIFNMLYDNESFDAMMQNWAKITGIFSLSVAVAVKIIQSMQWVLRKMYAVVNRNYLALSREMEFHADRIAAGVAGYAPLKESLLRMDLGEHAYHSVLRYYEERIPDNIKSKNIYREQGFVMNFLANKNNLPFKNNLPVVSEHDIKKYNRSKLVLSNQWASHPSIEARIRALEATNIVRSGVHTPAMDLFVDAEKTQTIITEKLFSSVTYTSSASFLNYEEFMSAYIDKYNEYSFPIEYNGYYDNKNTVLFDVESIVDFDVPETMETLFCKDNVELVYDVVAIENDKNIVNGIVQKEIDVKSFDYNGKKYKASDAHCLVPEIEAEMARINERIAQNDVNIYRYFYAQAQMRGNAATLKEKYVLLFRQGAAFDDGAAVYHKVAEATSFIRVNTPFAQIRENLAAIRPLEKELKTHIELLLQDAVLANVITEETRSNFEKYLAGDLQYFIGESYQDDNLQVLFTAAEDCVSLLGKRYLLAKSDLVEYQLAQLELEST